jgi:hypothetical protein
MLRHESGKIQNRKKNNGFVKLKGKGEEENDGKNPR